MIAARHGARWMSAAAGGVGDANIAPRATKKLTEITTEAQFQVVLKKAIKSITDYVENQESSNKRLVKTLRRWQLLAKCRFKNDLPAEIVSFAFFLLSQLVQGRVNSADLAAELIETFSPLISLKTTDFDSGQLARVFWGYGDLGFPPEAADMDRLCQHLSKLLPTFSYADLVNVLASFIKYDDLQPSGDLIDSIIDQLRSKIDTASPAPLARTLVVLTRLSITPTPALVDAISLEAEKKIESFSTQELIELLHGLSPQDYQPVNQAKLLDLIIAQLLKTGLDSVGPRLVARVSGAFGLLEHAPSQQIIELINNRLKATCKNVSMSIIADIFVACGLGKVPLDAELAQSLLAQFRSRPYRVTATFAGNVMSGIGRLQIPVAEDYVPWMIQRAKLRISSSSIDELLVLLTGFEDVNASPDEDILFEVHGRCVDLLSNEHSEDVSPYFEAYRRLAQLYKFPCEELKKMLSTLTDRDPDNPEVTASGEQPNEDEITDPDELMRKQLERLGNEERTAENTEDFYDGPEDYEYLEIQSLGQAVDDQQSSLQGEEEDD